VKISRGIFTADLRACVQSATQLLKRSNIGLRV